MMMTAKGKYLVISAAAAILLGLCLILTSANAKAQSVPEQKTIVAAPEQTQSAVSDSEATPEVARVCAGRPLPTMVLAARMNPEAYEQHLAEAHLLAAQDETPAREEEAVIPEEEDLPAAEPAAPKAEESSSNVVKTSVPLNEAAAASSFDHAQRLATLSSTDPELFTVDNNSGNVPEGLQFLDTFIATAYCDYGLTATGTTTTVGRTIAVNPDDIPYGTHVWLYLDDGTFVGDYYAEDTGGNLLRQHYIVDIYMGADSYEQCINWGARHVSIYIDPNE